jgi:hypothetical protein
MTTGAEKWKSDVDLQGDVMAYKLAGNKLILAKKGTREIII